MGNFSESHPARLAKTRAGRLIFQTKPLRSDFKSTKLPNKGGVFHRQRRRKNAKSKGR
jgi:hypothetical protein